jgi:RNA-binding protein
MALTGKQRHQLRGLGHNLNPVVHVGKEGASDALVANLDAELAVHELVKVKLGPNAPSDRHKVAEELAERSRADLVQVLGRTVLLYRPAEEPTIVLV